MAQPASQLQRQRRRLKVSQLYLDGKTQSETAVWLKVSQGTISKDIKVLQRAWQISATHNIDKIKARELAKIDRKEREYWQAWYKSTQKKKEITVESPAEAGTPDKFKYAEKIKTWKEVEDLRYLQGVQWCIEQRIKILGIYAPENTMVGLFIPQFSFHVKSILLLFFILIASTSNLYRQDKPLEIGVLAQGILLKDLNGQDFFLSDYCGKPRQPWKNPDRYAVVISFFATYCAPCLQKIPELEALSKEFNGKVKFFIIDVKEEKMSGVLSGNKRSPCRYF